MKKVVYIVSDVEKALAFEWMARFFKNKYDMSFILIGNDNTALVEFLRHAKVRYNVVTNEQYPNLVSRWIRVFNLVRKEKPQVVHIHLWRAMQLGLTASWLLRVPKRIFTRHHAMVHYVEHPSGRKWDVLFNKMATDIIAISANVKSILIDRDGADPRKIHLLHHGFDIDYFGNADSSRVSALRSKYNLASKTPVIGVVSRYVEWKGIQYIIPAFAILRKRFPDAHLVLANATGDYTESVRRLLEGLPAGSYTEIRFENDLSSLYRCFDVFVHAPTDADAEAFGQTYVEALMAGVPSVFTMSGVALEFIQHRVNALVVPHRDAKAIANACEKILSDPALRQSLVANGRISTAGFSLQQMLRKLGTLYG